MVKSETGINGSNDAEKQHMYENRENINCRNYAIKKYHLAELDSLLVQVYESNIALVRYRFFSSDLDRIGGGLVSVRESVRIA